MEMVNSQDSNSQAFVESPPFRLALGNGQSKSWNPGSVLQNALAASPNFFDEQPDLQEEEDLRSFDREIGNVPSIRDLSQSGEQDCADPNISQQSQQDDLSEDAKYDSDESSESGRNIGAIRRIPGGNLT